MKLVFIFIIILKFSYGDWDLLADLDLNHFLQALNHKCPVMKDDDPCPAELTYWLYTRENRNGVQLFENELNKAKFANAQLKFLIHGYWNDRHSEMNTSLMNAYLDYGVYNVVVVDWGHWVKKACYFQGVASINPIAGCVTAFMRKLMAAKNFGIVHMLGHSLGAHVSARVSSHFDPPINRLTRFDPAIPLFIDAITNKGKAEFRDVYHSNIGILGQSPAEGDADIYLNNGQFQPGCGCSLQCSHMRSVLYFAESISKGMKGFYCSSWHHFIEGKCKMPKPQDLKEVGDHIDIREKASFTVFGKPSSPFLYDAKDYLNPNTFNHFRELGRPDCDASDFVRMVKEFLS